MAPASTPGGAAPAAPSTRPAYDVGQEIRFAVVLYGGVSLAIYMNGIAQELLHLVRATAGRTDGNGRPEARYADEELSDTEPVYRQLGMMLSRQGVAPGGAGAAIRTRFIVDTISGTSAGGINGIFLAKALANDQSIAKLEQLWITEGDIGKLVNDRKSADNGLTVGEPKSLLNGDRMYLKLLSALRDMDDPRAGGRPPGAPLVDDLHLYVTTTDIRGLPVPLRLDDRQVMERRHKHVFHFIEGRDDQGPRHDFELQHNRFLAYAARCTSSFPFAFEPMRLAVVQDLAPLVEGAAPGPSPPPDSYARRFFEDYARTAPQSPLSTYGERSFGDGGYLDNKPFGYAIDALALRADLLPSERKLVYVEPTPERLHPGGPGSRVDVLENVTAALFTLPTYETIREDLQRVLARNRLIDRIDRVTQDLENDVAAVGGSAQPLDTAAWRKLSLNELIARNGVAYGGYHRLKVAAATDDLAALATAAVGLDPRSDHYLAVRYLIGEWRAQTYAPNPSGPTPLRAENEFLLEYGLGYRFRRLGFVRTKIDMLLCSEDAFGRMLGDARSSDGEANAAAGELLNLKVQFGKIFEELTAARDRLGDPVHSSVGNAIKELNLGVVELEAILAPRDDEGRRRVARQLLATRSADTFRVAIDKATRELSAPLVSAAAASAKALQDEAGLSAGARRARAAVKAYYDQFENYDFVTFPLRYATDVGEIDKVSVIRISPEDVDQQPTALAGAKFAHFGGFLKRDWRENDILLGRLHGAERLISTLLPGDDQRATREALIDEAHRAILLASVRRRAEPQVTDSVIRGLAQASARGLKAASAPATPAAATLEAMLRSSLTPAQLLAYYRTAYAFDPSLPAQESAEVLGRATRVVGRMLEGLAREYHTATQPGAWIARVGGAFWQLVQIAVPGSLRRVVFEHWMALVALTGILVIAASVVLKLVTSFDASKLSAIGLLLALLPTALMIAVWALSDYLHRGRRGLRVAGLIAVGAVLALAALGVWKLTELVSLVWT